MGRSNTVRKDKRQHVFLVGAKSIGAYGGPCLYQSVCQTDIVRNCRNILAVCRPAVLI